MLRVELTTRLSFLPWQRSGVLRRLQPSPYLSMTHPMNQRMTGAAQKLRGLPGPGNPACRRMMRGLQKSMTSPGSGRRNGFPKPSLVSFAGAGSSAGASEHFPGSEWEEWTLGAKQGLGVEFWSRVIEFCVWGWDLGSTDAALCVGHGYGKRGAFLHLAPSRPRGDLDQNKF